jgi:RHS repeat-associated protein
MNYTYNSRNRLTISKNQYLNKQKNFSYDTNGVLSQLMYSGPTAFPDIDINFTRDDSGLITSITGDKELNVTYNSDLEIESVQHILPQPFDESYTYDARGNRLTSLTGSYTYNDLNQLTGSTINSYSYDADGNLIEEKNKITTETKKYHYNSENRLIGFEHYPNDVSPADTSATYKYDIYGRRLQKNVNGTVINFNWEGDNLALELEANYQPIRRYVYGLDKDDVEGYVEYSEVSGGFFDQYKHGWYSYVKDQVGTISKVYSENTQQMVETRTYGVFGELVNQTGTSTGNLGFQGKYYDKESGLYYLYNRYYYPTNGRFIKEDPIGLSGGLNMYLFVSNNPIHYIDPFGLDAIHNDRSALIGFCEQYIKAKYGRSQLLFGQEVGAWIYYNPEGGYDFDDFPPSPDMKDKMRIPPADENKRKAGSCHVHNRHMKPPPSYPEDIIAANLRHPGLPMYIISHDGIWMYDPMQRSTDNERGIFHVMCWKDFCNFCKQNVSGWKKSCK